MSELDARRSSVREWIRIAEQDLSAAGVLLAHEPPFIENSLFLAQQAGEKYLKAFLAWHDAPFPKTHDLKYLLELCLPFDTVLEGLREACFHLSELAVEPRYPMPPPAIEIGQAREAEAEARSIRDAIRSRLWPDLANEA